MKIGGFTCDFSNDTCAFNTMFMSEIRDFLQDGCVKKTEVD